MALEDLYAKLVIEDEDQGVELQGGDATKEIVDYCYCLVGRFHTDRVVHFISIRNTMESIWHPKKGVCIKEMGAGIYVFQFYHPIDMSRVLENGPWTFNNHLLLLKHLKEDVNPMRVDLFETSLWVQIHEVPVELRSGRVLA
ncbi:unnamed protein product [Fraxinus pennsylvanica]|uniref:DUF4283 domain-containing protein n=1 Tax=Fraxinus pennsylvanica TaxID=56036 RepID=A0AAD2EFB5_9LAMI|nr:unnamed protein product [Fraxinus pennsylvanica]